MNIIIKDLKVKTIIGVKDFERKKKQTIHIDLEINFNLNKDFSDNIQETIDYDIIVEKVKSFTENTKFYTIEKLCFEIINTLFQFYQSIQKVKVKIRKNFYFKAFDRIYIEETKSRTT